MRIAQVAPLAEAVPPKLYGGTERVVSWLTEELVHRGHEVTLFASGDSITGATLVPACAQALRLAGIRDHLASHIVLMRDVRRLAEDFDIIHFHLDLLQHPTDLRGAVVGRNEKQDPLAHREARRDSQRATR